MPISLTVTIALVGWFYLLFLNNRALKRAEICRLKDDIVKQLLDSSEWLINEINSKTNSESELIWAAKITQIDLKSKLLNQLAKCQLIDFNALNALRNLDIIDQTPSRKDIVELTSDVIEAAELAYHDHFFKMSFIDSLALRHKASCLGIIFGFLILALFYHVMDIYILKLLFS